MIARMMFLLAGTASIMTLAVDRPAAAQQTSDPTVSAAGLEEVVVTARRREEKAQTVPIAINTFSQAALEQQDIRTSQFLSRNIPGLVIVSGTRGSASSVFLRGVPGVVIYFADVPTTLAGSALYFDLDNVQALKGPQGTLFGLNADGGALLVRPKKPTNNFEGYGQITLGDYNRHDVEGVVNIPVVDDKLLVRVGGDYHQVDGTVYDRSQSKYLNNDDYWVGRFSATLRPVDGFQNDFVLNWYYSHNNGSAAVLRAVNPTGLALRFFPSLANQFAQQQSLGLYSIVGSGMNPGTVNKMEQLNIIDTATWDVADNISLKNIAGYTEVSSFQRYDLDGTPLPLYDAGGGTLKQPGPIATYSDEVQLQGKSFDEKLTWVVGTFLSFNHQTDPEPQYNLVLGGKSGALSGTSGRTQAIYAQGTYDLSSLIEGLRFTAGYRYTWDWRSAFQNNLTGKGQLSSVLASDAQFHAPGYTFGLDYQLAPDTLVYVTTRKAYSSGGFNLAAPPQFRAYQPEYLSDVEAGIKADWTFGGLKARTNFDGFYGWYQNIQAPTTVAFTDATGLHFLVETQNAATAHIDGIEGDFTILPVEGLEVTGNFIWMEAKYDKYVSGGLDVSNTPFYYLPRTKYSLTGRYHLPIDASLGDLSIAASYTWQAHLIKNPDHSPTKTLPSFGTFDVNIDWNSIAGKPLDASFFMTNVFNNAVNVGAIGVYDPLGFSGVAVADPRMFGFKLRYRFGPGLDSLF